MPTAIVHIGFNKCGSTAIQSWLADNIGSLAEQGIAYRRTDPRPDTVCTNPQFVVVAYSRANRILWPRRMNSILGIIDGDSATQNDVADKFSIDFAAWADTVADKSIVISCEALAPHLNTVETVKALDTFLREHVSNVRYVAYIRRPVAWFISQYGHAKRAGQIDDSLESMIDRCPQVTFGPALATWLKAVGADRLEVRLFKERWLKGDGLIKDFCSTIGADITQADNTQRLQNTTYRDSRWFRYLLNRQRPKRPKPTVALHSHVNTTNAPQMAWIRKTFFKGREQMFNAWLNNNI